VRLVEVKQGILSKNDRLAEKLRSRFERQKVFAVNLISSPGTGKTALLERTLEELVRTGRKAAALVGDLETENDANRLARSGAPVRQITTSGLCHLEASLIESRLEGWELSELEYLFIENVGNLVCPSSFDLGEQLRVVLLSVTEGEDKPLKYPPVFLSSQVAVITKSDLAEPCDFQAEEALANIRSVNPAIEILQTSARTGAGLGEWLEFLGSRRASWLRSI
jgi:hydrogenase nickel incorporation protein HypB